MAAILPSQASTLVKQLGQASPLEGLQHLKRVQRVSAGSSSAGFLEIILHALPHKPVTDWQGHEWDVDEMTFIGIPSAVVDLISKYSLQPCLAQVHVTLHTRLRFLSALQCGCFFCDLKEFSDY